MKVNTESSVYREHPGAHEEFDRAEIKHLRYLLRRLRHLENLLMGEPAATDAGQSNRALYSALEVEALAFALTELGYLQTKEDGQWK